MKNNRYLIKIVSILAAGFFLAACGSNSDSSKSDRTKLTLTSNFSKTNINTVNMEEIAQKYMDENPEIEVEVQILSDYESTMKTKMAANDLPDLFMTHGWSSTRYNEFLTPLNDQNWYEKVNPLLKDNLTAKDGNIYALPIDADIVGIPFNKKVIEDAGIDPLAIKTWDDFLEAAEKIKQNGKTPLAVGGVKDNWTIGNMMDWVSSPFLVTDEKNNDQESLLDGTFNWGNYGPVYDLINTFVEKDYLNKDVREGTYMATVELFAKNEAGFGFFTNEIVEQTKKVNPDVEFGYIPIPSRSIDDEPTVITGEKLAVGVWKDSNNKEEALKFLDYLAEPDNVNKVSKDNGNPTGLVGDGYKTELPDDLNVYYENLKDLRPFGYFDRAYLPSGMWDSLTNAAESIVTQSADKKEILEKLSADYTKLYNQQND